MKIIVAGSRDLQVTNLAIERGIEHLVVQHAMPINWQDIEIVSGGAFGVDSCGERFSRMELGREPRVFPADWKTYGKPAGNIRNEQMARYADAAVIFLRAKGPTPGSSNMYTWMGLLGKPAIVVGV